MLLPFERLALESRRSPDDLIAALARVTQPPPTQFRVVRERPTSTFVGQVSRERLYFRRAIQGRNSFAPFLIGRVVPTAFGARIEAVMRPNGMVIAFVAMLAAAAAPAIVLSVAELVQRRTIEGFVWQPVALVVALYVASLIGFLPEARRMKRLLREVAGEAPLSFA